MSATSERLRRLQGIRRGRTAAEAAETRIQAQPEASASDWETEPAALEALEEGETVENSAGECYLVTRHFVPLEQKESHPQALREPSALGNLLERDPSVLAPLYPAYRLDSCPDFRRSAFLDIETTGLGGGAGIYAFMVGVGTFEPQERNEARLNFVVRQLFMRHPGEEPALLTALADLLQGCQSLVTFNGRSFDAPFLRGRYRYAGRFLPADVGPPKALDDDTPHLDLLHPARRLWRKRLGSCALTNLERRVLGYSRAEDDVPGSLIPHLYADYLHDGDGRMMQRVFYHNREDIVSMAALAEVVCGIFADPVAAGAGHLQPLDLLSMARLQAELERLESAEMLFRAALDQLSGRAHLAESFDGLGRLLKRQHRWEEAATVWQQWLTTVGGPDSRPYVELAKFYEWQSGDLTQAAMWTQWALHEQEKSPVQNRSSEIQTELRHRLARLQRKLGSGG
ncbi:MAG: ribonuclease H-like domain-containing protein [Caldilineaceae bacterium]|nr:ribonuclease H-like domain-containing protein [Caldilineaceae bacterium]